MTASAGEKGASQLQLATFTPIIGFTFTRRWTTVTCERRLAGRCYTRDVWRAAEMSGGPPRWLVGRRDGWWAAEMAGGPPTGRQDWTGQGGRLKGLQRAVTGLKG